MHSGAVVAAQRYKSSCRCFASGSGARAENQRRAGVVNQDAVGFINQQEMRNTLDGDRLGYLRLGTMTNQSSASRCRFPIEWSRRKSNPNSFIVP